MSEKILIFKVNDYDLLYTAYDCKDNLEKLMKKIHEFKSNNILVEDLDELFSMRGYNDNYFEGIDILVTPFIKEWFGVGAKRFDDNKFFNWIQSRLRDKIFDGSLVVTAIGNEVFQSVLSDEDKYTKKIKHNTVIDYDKLKRMLISFSRYNVLRIVESFKLCHKFLRFDLQNQDLSPYGFSLEDDYEYYKSEDLKDFFEGLEDFDKNISPTLNSYWEHVFDYCRKHPLDKYCRFLSIYDPISFNMNYLSCRIEEKELIIV